MEDYTVSMCVDCAMWHANGELPYEANEARRAEIVSARKVEQGASVYVVGDESHFSWRPCDVCDNGLGGDRLDGLVFLS